MINDEWRMANELCVCVALALALEQQNGAFAARMHLNSNPSGE